MKLMFVLALFWIHFGGISPELLMRTGIRPSAETHGSSVDGHCQPEPGSGIIHPSRSRKHPFVTFRHVEFRRWRRRRRRGPQL